MSDAVAPLSPPPGIGMPLRLVSDERLAALVRKGSERAFAAIYQRHHAALYRYCRTIVRHEQDAQDVLQTTMVRALSALGRGVPDAPIRPWLFRIAHNEAITLLRRRQATDDIDEARTLAGPPLEAGVEQRDRLATLVADLQELPERQRGALVMRELSGLSHEEIARSLDISVGAAKQAIFDARTGLQEFQKGRVMDCAEIGRVISDGDGRMLRGRPVRAHLRSCQSCSELRDAIRMRSADLALLAPPLPVLAAGGLLAKILGAGAGGHGGAGGAGGLTTATAAGKAGTALFAGKALATVAVVATVGVGASQTISAAPDDRAQAPTKLLRGAAGSARAALDSSRPTAARAGTTRGAATATATATAERATKASAAKAPAGSSSSSSSSSTAPATPAATASTTASAHGKATAAAAAARGAEKQAAHRPEKHAAGSRRGSRPTSAGTQSTGAAAGHAPVGTGPPAGVPAAAAPTQSSERPTAPVTPPAPAVPAKPAPASGAPGGAVGGARDAPTP